jgi:hypothetical protein
VDVPPGDPCVAKTWYRDRDGDGFGGTETKQSCDQPSGYVAQGGDCHDDNENVFPGQTKYFGTPYTTANGSRQSYDVDCDGVEEQSPPPRTRGGNCVLNGAGNACNGSGYIPLTTRPAAPGIDPLCGPVKLRQCTLNIGGPPGCTASETTAEATQCR